MAKKGLRYYSFIFGVSTVATFIYMAVTSFGGNDLTFDFIMSILLLPFLFTLFLFIFDSLLRFILPKKKKPTKDLYAQFLIESTTILQKTNEFDIEDFTHFRNNEKFQRALKILFKIDQFGETPDANYKMVEKRFKKGSKEYQAIHYLIQPK